MSELTEREVKAIVDDEALRCSRVEAAGARLTFVGQMHDRRYDTPDRALTARDHVLRLRVYVGDGERKAVLDWKGPTRREDGFKLREEISTRIGDPEGSGQMLRRLGYEVTREIDRRIRQYDLYGATIRFERYPRLYGLVEVEGAPAAIERAIEAIGIPRSEFTADNLADFAARYEREMGVRAALSRREIAEQG